MAFIRAHQLNVLLVLSSICFMIFIFCLMTNFISKEKKKALLFFVLSTELLLFTDRLAYIYRGQTEPLDFVFARVFKFLTFFNILNVVYGFDEYIKCIYKENHPDEKLPKAFILVKVILIIGYIMLIISQFTNLYYSFDADNVYHREKWYVLCYIFPLVATLIQYVLIAPEFKKTKKSIFIPLVLYFTLPIFASFLQLFFSGISLSNIIIGGVVIILYCSNIYDNNSRVEDQKKIESELTIARQIQFNECPTDFPAFPDRKEFDLYAILSPARKVGGDFYDYFLIDDDHLGIVIADVSGKGVPAALNMVKAKMLIKGSLNIDDPGKILTTVNEGFLDNNKLDMFVTVWLGIVEISTGKLTYANAAHEDPVVYNKDTGFLEDETKHGIPIGTMNGYKYLNHEVQLNKGDKLFIYTDGIIDTVDKDENQFGLYKLLKTLNEHKEENVEDLTRHVKKELDNFAKGAEQFDDITMLCFELNDVKKDIVNKNGKFKADVSEIDHIYEYFSDMLETEIGKDRVRKYMVVLDEIYSNICKYAYNGNKDNFVDVDLTIDKKKKLLTLKIEDTGIKFNPLVNKDPNTKLSAKKRVEGGLGIFIVKKMMDKVQYKYKDNKNILVLEKKF